MSATGMPSVMATMTLMPASAASIKASAANAGGTNTMLTSAPVSCHSVCDRVEHGAVEVGLASLSRSHTTNHVGAVFNHLASVEGAFASCEALHNDLGVAVDENAHVL